MACSFQSIKHAFKERQKGKSVKYDFKGKIVPEVINKEKQSPCLLRGNLYCSSLSSSPFPSIFIFDLLCFNYTLLIFLHLLQLSSHLSFPYHSSLPLLEDLCLIHLLLLPQLPNSKIQENYYFIVSFTEPIV